MKGERGLMIKIGVCQLGVTADKDENLRKAGAMLEEAAAQGADFAVLPEMFNCPYDNRCFPAYAEETGGRTWKFLSDAARENNLYLIGGSIPEREGDKIYNSSYIFSPQGQEIGHHRKVHLFDVNIEGKQRFKESDVLSPGEKPTVVDTEFGKIGVAICFDIRFTEFFRVMSLKGARFIFVPGAFNMTTGPAHWELAFRSRAVDNQCFTIGCAPARDTSGRYVSYANSIVCNPWGDILGRLGEKEELMVVEIDPDEVDSYRRQIPILSARRTDIYDIKSRD